MNTCKGKTCDGACEAGRKYCNACLGAFRMKRKLQEERREGAGLCRRCSATAAPGDYLCPRHRGNHRYLFPLNRAARRACPASLPYPKLGRDLFATGRAA